MTLIKQGPKALKVRQRLKVGHSPLEEVKDKPRKEARGQTWEEPRKGSHGKWKRDASHLKGGNCYLNVVVPYLEVVCTVGLDEVEEGLPVGGVHQPVVEHPVHLMAPQPPQKAFIEKNFHFYFYGSIVYFFFEREREEGK